MHRSVLLLRVFALLLIIACVVEIVIRFCNVQYLVDQSRLLDNDASHRHLAWSEIDIEYPPSLINVIAERLRLNELLSRQQYRCQNSTDMGIGDRAFPICSDYSLSTRYRHVLSIISDPFDDGSLEMQLNAEHYVILARRNRTWMMMKNMCECLSFDSINLTISASTIIPIDNWHKSINQISNLRTKTFEIVKFDMHTDDTTEHIDLLDMIGQLLMNISIDQLHLIIHIDQWSSQDHVYSFYLLLNRLFYQYQLALFAARQSGQCGLIAIHCRYQISLIRLPTQLQHLVDAPVFGIGSPIEEYNRLMQYILNGGRRIDCNADRRAAQQYNTIPLFCTKYLTTEHTCRIFYLGYFMQCCFGDDHDHHRMLHNCNCSTSSCLCTDPIFPDHCTIICVIDNNTSFCNTSLLPTNDRTHMSTDWSSVPIAQLIDSYRITNNHQRHSLLIIQLDGAEWDVLDTLLQSNIFRKFDQIVLRIHVWFGEENENYRRFYTYLTRIEKQSFQKLSSMSTDNRNNTYDIVFISNRSFLTES